MPAKKYLQLVLKLSTLCLAFALNGCVTRREVEAATWLNNFDQVPKEFCGTQSHPGPLWDLAFYRRLDNKKFQIVRLCSSAAVKMASITKEDYDKILEALRPEKQK
jgi:hypothetical protein